MWGFYCRPSVMAADLGQFMWSIHLIRSRIFFYLDVMDMISLGQTCTTFHELCSSELDLPSRITRSLREVFSDTMTDALLQAQDQTDFWFTGTFALRIFTDYPSSDSLLKNASLSHSCEDKNTFDPCEDDSTIDIVVNVWNTRTLGNWLQKHGFTLKPFFSWDKLHDMDMVHETFSFVRSLGDREVTVRMRGAFCQIEALLEEHNTLFMNFVARDCVGSLYPRESFLYKRGLVTRHETQMTFANDDAMLQVLYPNIFQRNFQISANIGHLSRYLITKPKNLGGPSTILIQTRTASSLADYRKNSWVVTLPPHSSTDATVDYQVIQARQSAKFYCVYSEALEEMESVENNVGRTGLRLTGLVTSREFYRVSMLSLDDDTLSNFTFSF